MFSKTHLIYTFVLICSIGLIQSEYVVLLTGPYGSKQCQSPNSPFQISYTLTGVCGGYSIAECQNNKAVFQIYNEYGCQGGIFYTSEYDFGCDTNFSYESFNCSSTLETQSGYFDEVYYTSEGCNDKDINYVRSIQLTTCDNAPVSSNFKYYNTTHVSENFYKNQECLGTVAYSSYTALNKCINDSENKISIMFKVSL